MNLLHLFRTPVLSEAKKNELLSAVQQKISPEIRDLHTEYCFNIEALEPLTPSELKILKWLLAETFAPENFSDKSFIDQNTEHPPNNRRASRTCLPDRQAQNTDKKSLGSGLWAPGSVLEVGPRMNFSTAWSTNAVAVCRACGLDKVSRIERSRRYKLIIVEDKKISTSRPCLLASIRRSGPAGRVLTSQILTSKFFELIHDRMTECLYPEPLVSFDTGVTPEPVFEIHLKENGRAALEEINRKMGLGLDEWDMDYYYNLFVNDIGRNPTNVECFDLSQSNSEHSRHWFFKGKLIIDGMEIPYTLMDVIKKPLEANPGNSVIAFKDNSSAIRGHDIETIIPEKPGELSRVRKVSLNCHITFTAETHNFPSGVAPFPGAETGTGGRIRDVEAVGRGGLVIAGTAAYCVGNLQIPGYDLPWEDRSFNYPDNLASPLDIEIQASNGASDYGNKFGEPVIQGFTRSFGMKLPDGDRCEWIKPIMFTGGVGQMDSRHIEKQDPEKGMLVVKIGGPAYRIGIGGGAASSMIQGENVAEMDFNAVQRGDAEMEQKLNRVIRACVELGEHNPVVSIHDQGAGGNCNVVKEIIYPAGAKIEVRNIQVADNTLSVLEIWGAEYQEQNALLLEDKDISLFHALCHREKVPYSVIGRITNDGYAVLYDESDGSTPVNLSLEKILGDMPQKIFRMDRIQPRVEPLNLPAGITVRESLDRVLRLVSVGSKRFLTNKVDRSVTGLVARQQCAGPLQLTVSDAAVISQSHLGLTGSAISIGEQPIKGLIDPAAMARMTIAEALTNIVWAKISALEDIKCSGNWMWAPKLPGEGAKLYDAAAALSDFMIKLGIAIDGGKDSLSMATQLRDASGARQTVKSPATLVISAYAPCPDITMTITPDIKKPGLSRLIYIDLGMGKDRLGGSALAQVYGQTGSDSPDIDSPDLLKRTFNAIQRLIYEGFVFAGHDRSDGGLITTLLEMAFSGNCGIDIDFGIQNAECGIQDVLKILFSEEAGLVFEYTPEHEDQISEILKKENVPFKIIGKTLKEKNVKIAFRPPTSDLLPVLNEDMRVLRDVWEETSFQLERFQTNPGMAEEEKNCNYDRKGPDLFLSFTPEDTSEALIKGNTRPKVAIIREEGSNSDREMTSAFYLAGFEPWDVTMTDFLESRINLRDFKGMAFVGGFSYADVLDSAKGWAGVIKFNNKIWDEFQQFYDRKDTFSLGVCNGCQLMALLGWVPWQGIADKLQPRFIHNSSGRFESRFSSVKILPGPSIMFKGMEDSVLGIWVAHGEGMAHFPDIDIIRKIEEKGLAPIRYVNDSNEITMQYPFNPNGSVNGIAGLCSSDGRHLAIMPHPERTFLKWQWPWMPEDWKHQLKVSPWLKIFQNARQWCGEQT